MPPGRLARSLMQSGGECIIDGGRSIMPTPPDSISDLADRLGRNYSDVHGDVTVLVDHEIVYFDTDG